MNTRALNTTATAAGSLPVPEPSQPISIRTATIDDLPFIDGLQKTHTKMVGWMPTKQLENYIVAGDVLVAEGVHHGEHREHGEEGIRHQASGTSAQCLVPSASLLGYCISRDRYFKRDDCGIVYQLNIAPGSRRGLIGASLLREVFQRAAWGCKLFCCWCAQDLEANHFWQAMGFTPLAFRTGSDRKQRIHIFWQKRIRTGDTETPWWFPSTTNGGAVRADRIVLPIPPGVKWNDPMPIVLPGLEEARKALTEENRSARINKSPRNRKRGKAETSPTSPDPAGAQSAGGTTSGGNAGSNAKGLRFGPSREEIEQRRKLEAEAAALRKKAERSSRPRRAKKVDPKYVEQARELRDRYLEAVNTPGNEHLLGGSAARYEVGRLPAAGGGITAETPSRERREEVMTNRLLDAA